MLTPLPSKRAMCDQCHYPQSTCLCEWVKPISAPLNIIVLQHPSEEKHAKNTVRLLQLGLANISVLRGESPTDFSELVELTTQQPNQYRLCYPSNSSMAIESINHRCNSTNKTSEAQSIIFIDASWRKALKMWHLNPWLQSLQSWHFDSPPTNQYQIRHTTQNNSLSTLESVAYVLRLTHEIDCSPLLKLLSHMQRRCFNKSYQLNSDHLNL